MHILVVSRVRRTLNPRHWEVARADDQHEMVHVRSMLAMCSCLATTPARATGLGACALTTRSHSLRR